MSVAEKEHLRKAFSCFDKDRDGTIQASDLKLLLTQTGSKETRLLEAQAREILNDFEEVDGRIKISELVDTMTFVNAAAKKSLGKVPKGSKGSLYCVCGGTRGDQQPLVMTASRLQELGYEIVMCIGPEGRQWASSYGFRMVELTSFESIVNDDEKVLASAEQNDANALLAAIGAVLSKAMEMEAPAILRAIEADPNAVGIIATTTHCTVPPILARKLNIPCYIMALQVWTPTNDFPPFFIDVKRPETWQSLPGADGKPPGPYAERPDPPREDYHDLWMALCVMVSHAFKPVIEQQVRLFKAEDHMVFADDDELRRWVIDLMTQTPEGVDICPMIHCYSGLIYPKGTLSDASAKQNAAMTGFIFDRAAEDSEMSPISAELRAFLDGGEPPVYLGWGSMSRERNDELCRAAVGACKVAGVRGIVLGGWAHLKLEMLGEKEGDAELIAYAKERIFFVDRVNQILLFPLCRAVVTHGGMGTFACMLRSGKPGVICPVWWDQNFCGDRLELLGIGKRGPHFASLTADNLGALLIELLATPSFELNAAEMRRTLLAQKPGDEAAAELIDQHVSEYHLLKNSPLAVRERTASEVERLGVVVRSATSLELQASLMNAIKMDLGKVIRLQAKSSKWAKRARDAIKALEGIGDD
jgi:UDP:flavonoid glycosyltransferase YjiC (YdhE family)